MLALPGIDIDLRSNEALFYFALVVFALVLVGLWRLVHSPFGRVLRAIKQNEMRARFVGHNVWLYKWLAFVISAGVAGLAGGLFAMAQQSAYPNVMSLHNSGFVVMMVLIGGGLVSFWGPVIGALFFILARDLLGAYTETWLLWYGLLFMAMVLFQPDGVAGAWQHWRGKLAAVGAARRRPSPRPPPRRGHEHGPLRSPQPAQALRRPGRAGGHDAAFDEGDWSGIMGPNGAGKTTCFNVLTGRYRPDRGEVRFDGDDITGLSPRQIARKGLSRSFQIMNLFNDDTALDNVMLALPEVRAQRVFSTWRDLGRDERRARAGRAGARARRPRGQGECAGARLSYGERRALEIGVALAAKPRLLFLDEPTAGLGSRGTARLAALIAD